MNIYKKLVYYKKNTILLSSFNIDWQIRQNILQKTLSLEIYLVSGRKPDNLFKYKAVKNFNHRYTSSISRIKIFYQRRNWAN